MQAYQQQVAAFLRREHTKVSVRFAHNGQSKLLMLPVRATLNDVFRQLDSPKLTVMLFCSDGRGIPRTDEYVGHYLARMGIEPWLRRPTVHLVHCVSGPLQSIQILSEPHKNI